MSTITSRSGEEIFIMNGSGRDNPFSGKKKKGLHPPPPGQSPKQHERGISIFQNPDASSALPRDVEMSLSLYETADRTDDRTSMYSTVSATTTTSSTRMSQMGKMGTDTATSSTVSGASQTGSYHIDTPSEGLSGTDTGSNSIKTDTELTGSSIKDTAALPAGKSDNGTSGAFKPPGSNVAVTKAGSFQFKTADPPPGVYRSDSSRSTSAKPAASGESYSRVYKANTTVLTTTTKSAGLSSGTTAMAVAKKVVSSDTPLAKDMTMPLKIATSGQRVVAKATAIEQKQQKQHIEEENNSSKTSLSSYTVSEPLSSPSPASSASASASGSQTKLPEPPSVVVAIKLPVPPQTPAAADPKMLLSTQSNDNKSVTSASLSNDNKSVISASLSNLWNGSSPLMVTEGEDITTTQNMSATTKTMAVSSTTVSSTTTPTVQGGSDMSSTQQSVLQQIQTSSSKHSAKDDDLQHSLTSSLTNVSQMSEASSVVKNKEFKAKMNSMMATAQTPTPKPKPNPMLKFNTTPISYGKTKADSRSLSPTVPADDGVQVYKSSTTVPADDGVQVYKSSPTSPIAEMKDTIVTGKVGNLAKSGMFKHLTGRSIDPSTLERKRAKSNQDQLSPSSPGEKKYRFDVEGIDVPEKEKTEEKAPEDPVSPPPTPVMGPNGIPLPPPPPPPPPGSESDTRSIVRKKGFSYVLDEKLASAIVKKAEDVTARKAYEQVEDKVQTKSKHVEANQHTTVIVQAKAKLHKRESNDLDEPMSPTSPRPPTDQLMEEIRFKLGGKPEGGSTEASKARSATTPASANSSTEGNQATTKQPSVSNKVSHSQSFKAVTDTNVAKREGQHKSTTSIKNSNNSPAPPVIIIQQASTDNINVHDDRSDATSSARHLTSHTTVTTRHRQASSDRRGQQEDVTDFYTTPSLGQRAISQQDIIKAALTSSSFREDYHKQAVFSSSSSSSSSSADEKQPACSQPSVTADEDRTDYRENRGTKREDRPQASTTTTTTTTATATAAAATDTATVSSRSSARVDRTVVGVERKAKGNSSSNSSKVRNKERRDIPLDGIDAETTTWNLKVDTAAADDGQYSQLSTTSSKRRIQFERIHSDRGVVQIDLGETEVDDTDQEVRNVTDRLQVNVADDTGSAHSGRGGLLVINTSSSNRGHSPSGESQTSTLRTQHGDGLPEDRIVYHIRRKDRAESLNLGGAACHIHEDPQLRRHLSPPPAPGYVQPVHSLQGSRAVSRSNSSLHSHPVGRNSSSLDRRRVVNLLPLSVDVGQQQQQQQQSELGTRPAGVVNSPAGYNMAVPAVTANHRQFDTSQMRATSTLNNRSTHTNQHAGGRELLNSTGSASDERDVNMNNIKSPHRLASPRYLTGELGSPGRTPIRKSHSNRHVSNVRYSSGDMPVYDTLEARSGKYRVQNVMDRRRAANNMTIPVDKHPDIAYKKQKFYSVSRETHSKRNGAIVSAAPQLETVSKNVDNNYNVTLKLNTSQLGGEGGSEREEREEREEYEERVRVQRQIQHEREERAEQMRLEQMRTERLLAEREERLKLQKMKAGLQREEREEQMRLETMRLQRQRDEDEERARLEQVRAARRMEEMEEREEYKRLEQLRADRLREQREEMEEQMRLERIRAERMREEQAEHEDNLRLEQLRAQRIREEQRQVIKPTSPRYVASAQLTPPIDHISFTNYHGPQEGVISRQQQQQQRGSTHIVTDIGSSNTTRSTTNGEPPRFTMCIDQTMKVDYAPPGEAGEAVEPADSRQQAAPSSNAYRRTTSQPVDEMVVPTNNMTRAARRKEPQPVDEMLRPSKQGRSEEAPPTLNGYDDLDDSGSDSEVTVEEDPLSPSYPNVVRGSILIKNSIDTAGAPKVFDVVEGESDTEDNPLCEDNTNMFQGNYFQARENPMYSSDPDLSRAREHPQFTQLFQQPTRVAPVPNGHISDNDSDIAIPVSRESYQTYRRATSDQVDGTMSASRMQSRSATTNRSATTSRSATTTKNTTSSEFEISSLLRDAPPGSIKQTINVEREEEEIIGPLPEGEDGSDPKGMLNFDTVSEKVDLGLIDGVAHVAVKVRCERVVPIRGVEDMFKKSSVIVTRLIEIDLTSTDERRRLYDNIMHNSTQATITDSQGRTKRTGQPKLSTKQTFSLYKTFMGLAEADEASKKNEYVQIDRRVEEEAMPQLSQQMESAPAMNGHTAAPGGGRNGAVEQMQDEDESETDIDELDRQLEESIAKYAKMKTPEPDAESYMSAVSENHSMMY